MMRVLIAFFCCLLITACSINPVDRGEGNMLALRPVKVDKNAGANTGRLVIDYPTSAGEVDTSRVALMRPNGTLDYYAATRWTDFLPVIVQTTLTETLALSGTYAFVRSDDAGLGDGHLLKSHIRHFEAVYPAYMERPPEVRIEIDFDVVDVKTDATVKSFTLRAGHQAIDNTTAAIHVAFLNAFADVQQQLVSRL